ncbi:MAG: isoprenylcysteine carboxylmethyltransferase family protein [Methanothrix sp.]|nr:isoprenylcysteine carboxylmethyltransferase family protein [Methanothrix sp.]
MTMVTDGSIARPKRNLLANVLAKFIVGIIVVGVVIFVPAGSLSFWNGWLYLVVLGGLMTCALIYLYLKDPTLLEERLKTEEKQKEQKIYQVVSLVWSLFLFIIPGLDYRFGWSSVPSWLVVAAVVIMVASYTMFFAVMVQNKYASRVIKIQDGQRLIDRGLYSIVRHPMYLAGTILFTASPVVLGSFYALLLSPFLPLLLVYRIKNEERLLLAELEGYGEYTKRVKYRLVPHVW